MTQMPEFIEPTLTPEEAAAMDDMAAAITAAHPTTPEEAAATALALAEQMDAQQDCPAPARAGIDHPGPQFLAVDEQPPAEQHDYAPERDAEHEQAVPAAPPVPEQAPPEPMMAGTYAIYDDGAGGVWLVIGPREGGVIRKQIPAGMLKMAERFGGGFAGLLGGA